MASDLESVTDPITGMKADPRNSITTIRSMYAAAFILGIGQRLSENSLGPLTSFGLKYLPSLGAGTVASQLYRDTESKYGFNGFIEAGTGTAIAQAAGYFLTDFLMR